jgi:hypothetical protein
MIAMTILVIMLGLVVQFFRKQQQLMAGQSGRLTAQQNGQFTAISLERELRMAGAGVADAQPILVQADARAITFNVDLISSDMTDVIAVYHRPDANPAGLQALLSTTKIKLPNTTINYPDSTYMRSAGVLSGAETISYYLQPDSTSAIPGQFLLLRRVNDLPPTLVTRGIVPDSYPVFRYLRPDTSGALVAIGSAQLPLYHSVPLHNSPTDTGRAALIDSIRAVRLYLRSVYRDPKTNLDVPRVEETVIRLVNAGLIQRSTCGDPPLPPGSVTATSSAAGAAVKSVTLTWTPSVDDLSGQKDVQSYAVYRRAPSSAFREPFVDVPAGQSTYSLVDKDVKSNQMWVYGVAALDCTPTSSSLTAGPSVTVLP